MGEALDLVDVIVGHELARAGGKLIRAFQRADLSLGQRKISRYESGMRLVADAGPDADLVNAVLAALDGPRLRHVNRGQRNQLVGALEVVILEQRLVDLLGELRFILGVGLHRVEVLRPGDEARVKDVLAALGGWVGIVPDLAASGGQRREHGEEDQEDAQATSIIKCMGFLAGRKILVTGVLSNRSIAYGIAKAARREGAEIALTYQNERFKDRVVEMARELGSSIALQCEVTSDAEIHSLFESLRSHWDGLDGLVHAIAFAPREAIAGDFLDGLSREAFAQAHDISAYSFPALAKAALPLMKGRKAALLTLTYLGAERVVPNYNTMGLAKASLEAAVRYLAATLGPRGIRVNGISAGPIKTLAAAGIGGFGKILKFVEEHAPLRRNVTIEDVGNAAAFLLSDMAAAVTGEILYVDAGFSHVVAGIGAPEPGPAN